MSNLTPSAENIAQQELHETGEKAAPVGFSEEEVPVSPPSRMHKERADAIEQVILDDGSGDEEDMEDDRDVESAPNSLLDEMVEQLAAMSKKNSPMNLYRHGRVGWIDSNAPRIRRL